jgi:nicotinate-nucleotide pyrophosphorylase (carboxylating)
MSAPPAPFPSLTRPVIEAAINAAFTEDLGLCGDITTNAIIPLGVKASATIAARQEGCIAGLGLAEAAFRYLDPEIRFDAFISDGEGIKAGMPVATVSGEARALLTAERVALNFLGHMSGIATKTQSFVRAVAGTRAKIASTRKTTPGLRALEKYAVRAGGGANHRYGLFDAILIKDNHIAAAGGINQAIVLARRAAGHLVKLEVEVDTLAQLEEALRHPVDAVLLDNMAVPEINAAMSMIRAKKAAILCEASGGVRLETVRAIAETGVDVISAGALTHSVQSLDVGLDF